MNQKKYIGGAFAKNDSSDFKSQRENTDFFSFDDQHLIGFETGADALAWILTTELKIQDLPVYFPLHYCEETLDRIRLKTANFGMNRYASIQEIQEFPAIIVWNHFNGYTPIPSELLNKQHIIIEDCVQSLEALHQQVGKASFTSLRKWLELDLAVVIGPYEHESRISNPSEYYESKKQAEEKKFLWKQGELEDEQAFLSLFSKAENALQTSEISFHSLEELQHYNWLSILEQRRKNAEILIDFLRSKQIEIVETSELFVMINIEPRDEIRRHLAQNGIFAPVHWLDSADKAMAKSLLSLPIDQRYTAEDMERIVTALEDGFKISGR